MSFLAFSFGMPVSSFLLQATQFILQVPGDRTPPFLSHRCWAERALNIRPLPAPMLWMCSRQLGSCPTSSGAEDVQKLIRLSLLTLPSGQDERPSLTVSYVDGAPITAPHRLGNQNATCSSSRVRTTHHYRRGTCAAFTVPSRVYLIDLMLLSRGGDGCA